MSRLPSPPDDFEDLRRISAEFGSDPLHVQGAGGNSSIKHGGTMWIKASGTMLADALTDDVFVATDLSKMQQALESEDPIADRPAEFLLPGGSGLRPSIETSLHAVFEQRVVLHTHCIHTIAHAIREDARTLIARKLREFKWAYVDYAKPGADLARSVRAVLKPETNVIVLGNHGLLVSGETIDEVRDLQIRVHSALALAASEHFAPRIDKLRDVSEGTDYGLPGDPDLHQLALEPSRVVQATNGSLYPDHVIFCGIGVAALEPSETLEDAVERVMETGAPPPVWLILPGAGVVVRNDAGFPARVMMRCLVDVLMRVPGDVALNYLSVEQNFELLNWDAEKYRQTLNAS